MRYLLIGILAGRLRSSAHGFSVMEQPNQLNSQIKSVKTHEQIDLDTIYCLHVLITSYYKQYISQLEIVFLPTKVLNIILFALILTAWVLALLYQ